MFRSLINARGLVPAEDRLYSTPGSYSLTIPENVTEISAVCVGAGGAGAVGSGGGVYPSGTGAGGQGGTLAYATVPVTPGETLTIVVGEAGVHSDGGFGPNGGASYISRSGQTLLQAPGGKGGFNTNTDAVIIHDSAIVSGSNRGGYGGLIPFNDTRTMPAGGGGGAGGYAGVGGNGGAGTIENPTSGTDGAGGAGGGGGAGDDYPSYRAGRGGSVGLYGQGANGAGASGRSDGGLGSPIASPYVGGGGSAGTGAITGDSVGFVNPVDGGVRIVWPGRTRRFPSTNVTAA